MNLLSALVGFRKSDFMSCELSKSLFLFFYFAKKCEDEFSLRNVKFEDEMSVMLSLVSKLCCSPQCGKANDICRDISIGLAIIGVR